MSHPRARRRRVATTAALAAAAALTLSTAAFAQPVGLPPTGQVNDDPANNINANEPAGVSDVVGGSLVAGGVNVPWATFEQKTGSSQQIFVRAFKNGAWTTQGFPASLNIDTNQQAEAPSIDFAGAGRTVPWVSWYEPNADLPGGATNIFASRFDSAAKVWIPEGQDRAAANKVPSLNIHTDRDAENPAVAGGATVAGNAPVPWVAWQEIDGGSNTTGHEQIFVSKGVKQTDCSLNRPGGGTSVSSFCWQQVGSKRLDAATGTFSAAGDTTLNIDPSRDGIEPDDAFTGTNDTVPWIVWYEEGASGIGLNDNQQVFAAKGVADQNADGGFKWVAVGSGTAGQTNVLDTSGAKHFGNCAASRDAENACSLNAVPGHDAENPRVATGSRAGGTTVPWIVWSEDTGSGKHAIFVSRLVGDHFELANNGQPISNTVNDSSRPDITFSGNELYASWQENVGGDQRTFVGHFEGPSGATSFHLDTPNGLDGTTVDDLRSPISSGCTANPFTNDGKACPGNAAGTPFSLRTLTDGRLLASGFGAGDVQTGAASAITSSSAHVDATADPAGATIKAHFEFGRTTGYELGRTGDQRLGPNVGAAAYAADLGGLPAGTLIHYRAVAETDFGSVAGPDRTLVTASTPPSPGPTPPHGIKLRIGGGTLHLSHRTVTVKLACSNVTAKCTGTVRLTSGGHLLGSARFSIRGGHSAKVKVALGRKAIARVHRAHRLKVRISAAGVSRTATLKA